MIFSPPSPCGHSPYLICDEQRERIESITLNRFIPSELYGVFSSPAVSRSMAGWRKAIGGSARRSRGVRIQANAQTPIRLYRAVKTQGRRRKKGEDRPSGASSADPDGDRGDEPNSPITAGASEFVLLAAEKNEQAQTSFFNPSVTT